METLAIVHLRNYITVKQTRGALYEIGVPASEAEVANVLMDLLRARDMRLRVQRAEGPGDDFDPVADTLYLFSG